MSDLIARGIASSAKAQVQGASAPIIQEFVANDGQTVFNLDNSYMTGKGLVQVEIDGISQSSGDGFTETSSTSITLSEGAVAGSKVRVTIYGTYTAFDTRLNSITQNQGTLSNLTTSDKTSLVNAINSNTASLADIAHDVKNYGAKGDGVLDSSNNYVSGTDDTAAIQSALNAGSTILIPDGIYMINAVTKLTVPSNRTIIFSPNAKLKVIPNGTDSYRVLDLYSADNVTLINPYLIGDRNEHTPGTNDGGQGHGIVISSGTNIKIFNPTCKNFWGDGITIYGASNTYLENVTCDNNRRQGITITSGTDLTINGALLTNTNGQSPQNGIDLEPNFSTDQLQNIRLLNITTKNNAGFGIEIVPQNLMTTAHEINILIENHKDDGSFNGFCMSGMRPTVALTGQITVKNPYYENSQQNGISILDYAADNSPVLTITKPTVVNPNTANISTVEYGSGIALARETTYAGTGLMGNIVLENPTVVDNRATALMKRGIYIMDAKSVGYKNVFILNPLKITGIGTGYQIDGSTITTGITVEDQFKVTKLDTTTQYTSYYNGPSVKFVNTGATATSQINLSTQTWLAMTMEFVNTTTYGLTIVPPAGMNIVPLSSVNGKYINTTVVGANIKLRRLNANSFIVESMQGTWTVQP